MALCNLEEVLIGLVWTEVGLEVKRGLRSYSLNFWSNLERIANPLLRHFVENF
jgi:hypothetical protein